MPEALVLENDSLCLLVRVIKIASVGWNLVTAIFFEHLNH